MSLDVYLLGPEGTEPCECQCGHEHMRTKIPEFYCANITHNLGAMAEAAGIYKACWRPEELGVTTAAQLVPLLREGLARLEADPQRFRLLDSPNGWGTYENFVPWVRRYLEACERHPDARVEVSR